MLATLALASVAGVGSAAAAAPSGFGKPNPGAFAPGTATSVPTPAPGNARGGSELPGGNLNKGPIPWTSTKTYPAGSLFGRAQANPLQNFKVIVQTKNPTFQGGVGRWAGTYGARQRSLDLINGVSLTLPGWAVLYIAENPQFWGDVTITEDVPVAFTGQTGPSDWQASIGADQLWSRPAVTCALSALGVPLDPTCTPADAYTAPQAPAIAVVDSGIDPTKVDDFGARIVARANFASDAATGDPLGHGTMVAGVAAGSENLASGGGVAQNAPLVDLRVANSQGEADTSSIIAALDWVLQNRDTYNIRVVNLSIVGDQETSFQFDPLDQAVERLWLNGITVVAAVGNNGSVDGPTINLGAPGNDPFIVTVGATDTNDTIAQGDDFRAPWSAYGYTPDGFIKPELSAPGRYMVAPIPTGSLILNDVPDRVVAPGYLWMSGTSFSSPAVAGVAAQLLALNPSWGPDQVKGALMAGATSLGIDGTGIGEVSATGAAAVTAPPNPNEGLEAFVQTDSSTGLRTFDEQAWANTVSTSSNWVASNWVASNWVASNWVASNWVASNWVASNWVASNWVASNWVQ